MDIPKDLAADLLKAEQGIDAAQEHMNGVQHQIALWHCSQGRHVIGTYTTPAIGRACIYCRCPAGAE